MRDVTSDEVEHYQQNGWAKLEGVISPELAAQILETVRPEIERTAVAERDPSRRVDTKGVGDRPQWRDLRFAARDHGIEPLRSLVYSPAIGRNAQKLIGRDAPVNYHADIVAVKMPQGHVASQPTGWHQDWVNFPFDRTGFLSFWIALEDMPAERGVMRFLSGSHHEGPLGKTGIAAETDLLTHYPRLADKYPISPEFGLRAGDATVHNGMLVHGAPENSTDRARFAAILSYHPADTCYTGAPNYLFTPELGLEVDKPIRHELFPVVTA
jgi:ectoine hydroxylase-related dioxygenase (phytanoyl-CoA dioxygenase family)